MRYQLCSEFNYGDKCRISTPPNELIAVKENYGMDEYFKTKEFLKSIEGKVVELIFVHGDAMEINDNNYWLPKSLWDAV